MWLLLKEATLKLCRAAQKFIFSASWMMRESAVVPTLPVDVPIVERMLPKAQLAPGAQYVRLGSDNCGWLNMLKNSPRNWKLMLSRDGIG